MTSQVPEDTPDDTTPETAGDAGAETAELAEQPDGATPRRSRSRWIAAVAFVAVAVLVAGVAWLLHTALAVLKPLGLTQYGPEQLDFLRYRPVLLNTRLKEVFGYTPRYTSAEVFELYRQARLRQAAGNA